MKQKFDKSSAKSIPKVRTGIEGFDDITFGGLPKGRPTLVVGGPGSGKTLFGIEFLAHGANKYNEPGVFISFEESEEELVKNSLSLGINLRDLEKKKLLCIDYIKVEASEIVETGDYDLEGLFVRIGYAIDSIGAKRVVLDTIESIFSAFTNQIILRSELRRLFSFLKEKGVTSIITGERGESTLTRNGLEEYVSDAVITLDNRVINNVATRRLRVVKYRGSSHGSNEYPFLIDDQGFSVLPITSIGLHAQASNERISSGIADLDAMLGGKGYYVGSTILISGMAGTGKSSMAAEFIKSSCQNGKKAIVFSFEESPSQLIRNMRSIGIDLEKYIKNGLLRIDAYRPTAYGLEMHLVRVHKNVTEFKPDVIVIDPISSLMEIGGDIEVKSMLVRLVDYLKMSNATSIFTDLKHFEAPGQSSLISSLVDTWILVETDSRNGEMNRLLRLYKSRGMAHSNQIREFLITSDGIKLIPPYIGPSGVLTGSARYIQERKDMYQEELHREEIKELEVRLEQEKKLLEAQIVAIKAGYENKENELKRKMAEEDYILQQACVTGKVVEGLRSSDKKAGKQ